MQQCCVYYLLKMKYWFGIILATTLITSVVLGKNAAAFRKLIYFYSMLETVFISYFSDNKSQY
jgi:hypothetical protein